MAVDLKDIPPEVRKKLKLKKPRVQSMTSHQVKSFAFRVLNVIADCTPSERARILRQAVKLNAV